MQAAIASNKHKTSAEVLVIQKKTFKPLSTKELGVFKDKLIQLGSERFEGILFTDEGLKATSEESVFGSHQEHGTDTQNTTVAAITQDIYNNGALGINNALQRIKQGVFGKCKDLERGCGGNIELERLEAEPTATLCCACSGLELKKSH